MADEKKPTKGGTKRGFTTFRVYEEDGEDMSDLANMEGKTIADLFRELCAPIVRNRRIQKMEDRLKRLKDS